jgi:2-succinyl-6-hydroxy-2,4-cyclohexadiene-1-carboxylate synthase
VATQRLNGARYAFDEAGSGPPLLLLHGFTGSAANWRPLLPAFAAHFRVIAVDLLGHGRSAHPSDPARYRMPLAAADLLALLDALAIERAHLLGYSMGGRLALYTAVRFPQRVASLILESSSPGLATQAERAARRAQDEALADWIEAHGVAAFVARWEQLPLWASQARLPDEQRAALRAQRLQNSPAGLANSLRGLGTGAQPSLWPRLPDLTLPVLLLAGALDAKFVAIGRQMAAVLPRARLEIVPDAGHTLHWERPLAFSRLALDFLLPILSSHDTISP